MAKLPLVSGANAAKAFSKAGWITARQTGSHLIMIKHGRRYLNGNKKDTPLYRRLGQKVLDLFTNIDSGLAVTDSQSGFRAFAWQTRNVVLGK